MVGVRVATLGDAGALAGLRLAALVESGWPPDDPGGFVEFFAAWWRERTESHVAYVAELDGVVVGMAWLMLGERVPSPERRSRRFGDIQSAYVLRELRDQGIGTALLEHVVADAYILGLEHVTVHSSEQAVALYRRARFDHDPCWLRWEPSSEPS